MARGDDHSLLDRLRDSDVGVRDPNIIGDAGPTDVPPGTDGAESAIDIAAEAEAAQQAADLEGEASAGSGDARPPGELVIE